MDLDVSLIQSPSRILVIRLRYLGDTFLLRPALRALRVAFPKAAIDVLVTEGTQVGLEGCEEVNRVIGWSRNKLWMEIKTTLGLMGENYDWVIDFTGNDRSAFIVWITGASLRAGYFRAKQPWYFWRNRVYTVSPSYPKKKPHIVLQQLNLLETCGVLSQGTSIDLSLNAKALAWAEETVKDFKGSKILHAHLSSRDMQKSLPAPLVREVLAMLVKEKEIDIILTSGHSSVEIDYMEQCCSKLPKEGIHFISNISWHQLMALISKSDVYWGVDTAPMHVASALQKPILVHFGPSRVDHWRPLNSLAEVIVSDCVCLKQKRNTCNPKMSGNCFQNLSAIEVFERLIKML